MRKVPVLLAVLAGISISASATNPVLVDSGGTGNFLTVQQAINSWCVGGTNAGETAPFVINIKASTTYDEALTLDSRVVYDGVTSGGNVMGSIVIQSDTVGTPAILKLRQGANGEATKDDGLMIMTDANHDFTFRDLVFTRSLSTPLFTDEMVRVDEILPNANSNNYVFERCVFTQVDAAGNPMTTTKAGALLTPPARGGTAMNTGARLLQIYPDAGERCNFALVECTFYAGTSSNVTARVDGAAALNTGWIENCLSSYAGYNCFEIGASTGATAATATITVTGTDQKAGPLNCTAALWPSAAGHGMLVSNTFGAFVSRFLVYSIDAGSRGVSGGAAELHLTDTILNVLNYGVVDNLNSATNWDRVTVRTTNRAHYSGVAGTGSFTLRDCIIAGPGTKFGGVAPTGGASLNYSCYVTDNTNGDAIGALGASITVGANVINSDPIFLSKTTPTSASFMDVDNGRPPGHPLGVGFGAAGTAGAALGGGASFIGGTIPVVTSAFSLE